MKKLKKLVKPIISLLVILSMVLSLPTPVIAQTMITESIDSLSMSDATSDETDVVQGNIIGEDISKRDEFTKHFITDAGTTIAAQYAVPVHFKDDNDEYVDYDNSLTSTQIIVSDSTTDEATKDEVSSYSLRDTEGTSQAEEILVNKKSDTKVSHYKNSGRANLIEIERDDYTISWGYSGANIVTAHEKANEKTESLTGNDTYLALPNLCSTILYENIYNNIDLEVVNSTIGIKENLILKASNAKNVFKIEYSIGELIAESVDDQTIELKDTSGEVVYTISAPYMKDASGETSKALELKILSNNKGKLSVKLTADKTWLKDRSRTYPVIIDPDFKYGKTNQQITSVYVDSQNSTTNFKGHDHIYQGSYGQGTYESYLKINSLPTLANGDMIVNVTLNQFLDDQGFFDTSFVGLYETKSSWSESTITWSNKPDLEEALIDYELITAEDSYGWKDWDITELVKGWYNGDTNNGFALKAIKHNSDPQCIAFMSSNNTAYPTTRPCLIVTYSSNKGIEERWTYTPIDAGAAGVAYINDYSGNLVFQFGVASTIGLKLPVGLGLTYNSCMVDSAYRAMAQYLGYGWKMNLQQTLLVSSMTGLSSSSNGLYPYVYTDEDGTDHYFYIKTNENSNDVEYLDEEGLGFELSIDDEDYYIVTDENKTKRYFSKTTNMLVKIVDSHGQMVSISYEENTNSYGGENTNRIKKITDANGKSISIAYTDGVISSITDPANRVTRFTYDANRDYLKEVTNPDGSVIKFEYTTDGLLKTVMDIDKTTLSFGYSSVGSRGVTSVQEKDADGSAGQKVTFDRTKYNTTKMRTSGVDCVYGTTDDIVTTYQFDNWGKTVSVQSKNLLDEDLGASAYTYTTGEINADGTNIKKLNKLSSNYSLGANIENLARNHSMETVDDNNKTTEWTSNYWIANTVDFTVTPNSDLSRVLYGQKSLKIKVNSVSGDARGRVYQNIDVDYLEKGATYTLSAYVKTENIVPVSGATNYGAVVCVTPVDSDSSTSDVYAEHISRNTDESINKGFRRVSVTFEVPDNDSLTDIRIQLALRAATGTVYFDAVQLEKSDAASSYNMLENASFERLISTTRPENWTALQLTDSTAYDCISNASVDGSNSFRIRGDVSKWKNLYQIVNLGSDAKEEDTYILSGWATAHSMPIDSNGAKFRLLARVYYDDDSHKDVGDITFNDSLANVNWQYASGGFTLSDGTSEVKNPEYLKIYLVYNYQGNKAYFDNIQLIKEPVPSYTYDDEGNLTSVVANAEQKSEYDYQNGNLTYFKDPKGYECEFEYDEERKLLTKATTQLGANYSYVYDDYGNATSVEAEADNSLYLKSNVDYNYPEATEATYSVESYDQNNNKTVSVYDANTGNLKSVTDSKNNTTNYTYYQGNDLPEKISAGDQYVKYNYDGYNRLSTIEHGGTTYSFEYDSFGNNTKTKVGSHALATYDYEDYNGYIKKMTYGNNTTSTPNYVEYDYDRFGNYKTIYYNGKEVGYNFADASGLVTRTQDLLTNREHRISFDSTGRLISKEVLDLSVTGRNDKWLHSLEYNYDDNNNVTHFAFADKNGSYTTTYEYGKDNLLSKIVVPDGTNDGVDFVYSYDNLGRLTRKSFGITSNGINSVYTYSSSNRGTVNGKSYTTTLLAKEETPAFAYRYEYDSNGNISKIQNGTKQSNGSYSYAVKSGHWYIYDQHNQLTGDLNYDDATVTYYTYDVNGNLTSKLVKDYNIEGSYPMGVLESRNYLYSDTNGWGDLLTSWGGQTITYDAIGNPLTYRDGINMTWKNGRELKSVSKDGKTINFTYDLSGMRTNKTINVVQNGTLSATNVKYIYESGKLLQMRYGSRVLDFTYDSAGTPISLIYRSSETANPTYYYYGVNARGDVEALYTSSGAVSAKYNYDAYGKLLSVKTASGIDITNETSIAILNPLRYRGYVYDNETGFYYLQSRYYDPTTCRFINADIYYETGQGINGYNMFAYCNNNPVMYSDPTGHCATHGRFYVPNCFECNPEYKQFLDERGADWAIASRDVTEEVNVKLMAAANTARASRAGINSLHGLERTIVETGTVLYFKSQVQDSAPWDIKQPESWVLTIGTESPKYRSRFIYNGIEMNSADLGNYTYGYLGSAYGYSLDVLYGGSYVAAKFPTGGKKLKHEITQDWKYISMGYYAAESGNLFFFPPSIPTMN